MSKEFAVYNLVYSQTEESRNVLILQQRINEKTYEIEDGFRFTVHEALKRATGDEKADGLLICGKIVEWTKKSEAEGVLSSIEFVGEPAAMRLGLESCPYFMNVQNNVVTVGYNGVYKIAPWDFGVLSFDKVAFVFQAKVYNTKIKVLVPAGTVVT